jgi:demethylmenaquinone methyltransferase/2-methoxy-6-polyprenyl-1,4-benzoquinol methylase
MKPGGRLGIVCMAAVRDGEHDSMLEDVYKWSHHHFPHIVDCRPIDVEKFVTDAGFAMTHDERIQIWTMPVAVVVAK